MSLPDNMVSQNGKQIKIIKGYKLRFHKILKNDVRRWNCTNKNCKAYFTWQDDQNYQQSHIIVFTNVHEVVDALEIKNYDDEQFLMVNDSNLNIVMFSCEKNLNTLSTFKTIYVDGTFKYRTKFFLQLLTIYGLSNGHYITMVHYL